MALQTVPHFTKHGEALRTALGTGGQSRPMHRAHAKTSYQYILHDQFGCDASSQAPLRFIALRVSRKTCPAATLFSSYQDKLQTTVEVDSWREKRHCEGSHTGFCSVEPVPIKWSLTEWRPVLPPDDLCRQCVCPYRYSARFRLPVSVNISTVSSSTFGP